MKSAVFMFGILLTFIAVAVFAELWITFPPGDLTSVAQNYWRNTPIPATWYGRALVWSLYYLSLIAAAWPLLCIPVIGWLLTSLALKSYATEEAASVLDHVHTLEQTVSHTRTKEDFLSGRWDSLVENLDKVFEKSGELWLVLNTEGRIRRSNKTAVEFFRQSNPNLDTLEGRSLNEIWRTYPATPMAAATIAAARQGMVWHGEIKPQDEGPHFMGWVWPLGDDIAVLLRDVSTSDKSTHTLRDTSALAENIIEESGPTCIAVLDTQWKYLYVSRHWHNLFQLNPQTPLIGQSHARVIPFFPANLATISQSLEQGTPVGHAEEKVSMGGREEYLYWNARPWRDGENRIAGHVLTVMPVTELVRLRSQTKQTEDREHALAYADTLTGLPNRQLFHDRLAMAIAVAYRQLSKVALMYLDLDGFKAVNDTLGHEYGDMLLKQVAERLVKATRESDTVARLGGDEFTAILGVRDKSDAEVVAKKFLATLSEPFDLAGKQARIGVSIGIAMYPQDGTTAPDLIKRADGAMYESKKAGKNTYRFATVELVVQA